MFCRAAILLAIIVPIGGQDDNAEPDAEEEGPDPEQAEYDAISDDDLRQIHAALDGNGDKRASKQEVFNFVEKYHKDVARSRTEPLLKKRDISEDGFVSLDEHLKHTVPAMEDRESEHEATMFRAADANNDGLLDKHEVSAIGFPETNENSLAVLVNNSMKSADLNEDGKLSPEEFEAFGSENDPQQSVFSRLDTDGDGFIGREELRTLKSGRIGRENMVNEVLASLDTNSDGHLDSEELVKGKHVVYDSELKDYLLTWAKQRQIMKR